MHKLEEQAIREESKSHHYFLSACQAILHHTLQPLKENLTTSYHILLGQSPSSPPSAPLTRILLVEEQPSAAASPRSVPKLSPWPKMWHPLPERWGSMSIDETSPKATQEGTIQLWEMRLPSGPPHSNPVVQRPSAETLISWKKPDYVSFPTTLVTGANDGTNDLSDVFRELAESAGLLEEAIYEIQLSWTGPEELKQANYALWSLPKGLRFPKGSTIHRVFKGHGTHGHPWSWCPLALCRLHLLSLVWKGGAKWGNHG